MKNTHQAPGPASPDFEAVIGLEVHAELATQSKMFCACRVVDPTQALPNRAVCPVCAGMPGALPVVNQRAVEFGVRVALALECEIAATSIFARKNYFYPDLPKGYQITQYEQPLAQHGRLVILTSQGEQTIHIRRVHLEEDTGKLTHIEQGSESHTLIDLNRAGVPLLEIVTEPDMSSAEQVRTFAMALRSILRYLGVNSGDMQKGVMRIEPNISLRQTGHDPLGTRVEIKNLNSFRALEHSVAFEIQRQSQLLRSGQPVRQETRGWDDSREVTFLQRVKEDSEDYRYFPEPDLPPLAVNPGWVKQIQSSLPELPIPRARRFQSQFGLRTNEADLLVEEKAVADYFEAACIAAPEIPAKTITNWISGELFGLLNQAGLGIEASPISPASLAELVRLVAAGKINLNTAKSVLTEMFTSRASAQTIVSRRNLGQVSDTAAIADLVSQVLSENPAQAAAYKAGKTQLAQWFFGQVMRLAKGQANPQVVQRELERQLLL